MVTDLWVTAIQTQWRKVDIYSSARRHGFKLSYIDEFLYVVFLH